MKSHFLSHLQKLAVGAAIFASSAAWATQYQVTVSAEIHNTDYPSIFGLTDTTIPLAYSFTVDTAVAPVVTLPAGTAVGSSTLATKAQLIPAAAISGLSFSVGTGIFSASHLINQGLPGGYPFTVLLLGELADGATPNIVMTLSSYDPSTGGDINVGGYDCQPSLPCVYFGLGQAFAVSDGGQGTIVNISTTITDITPPPPPPSVNQQLAALAASVDTLTAALKKDSGAANHLEAAQQKLAKALIKPRREEQLEQKAIKALEAFQNSITVLVRKNKITALQGNIWIDQAGEIIDLIVVQ